MFRIALIPVVVLAAWCAEAAETGRRSDLAELVDGLVTPSEVAGGFAFTEGPAADAAGDVFFTDIPNQQIHVWRAATGKVEPWLDNTDKANDLFFAADGTLYACVMGVGRIARSMTHLQPFPN